MSWFKTQCPSGRPCLNYSYNIASPPDMDGCVGPCKRGEDNELDILRARLKKVEAELFEAYKSMLVQVSGFSELLDKASLSDHFKNRADAALVALAEPTDDMIEAGEEEIKKRRDLWTMADRAAAIYRAMIAVALEAHHNAQKL